MTKKRLHELAADSRALFKLTDNLWNALDKIPSFTGKARFMDKVLKIRTHAHNLRWNLNAEAGTVRKVKH
jgi:hypothetical protein